MYPKDAFFTSSIIGRLRASFDSLAAKVERTARSLRMTETGFECEEKRNSVTLSESRFVGRVEGCSRRAFWRRSHVLDPRFGVPALRSAAVRYAVVREMTISSMDGFLGIRGLFDSEIPS